MDPREVRGGDDEERAVVSWQAQMAKRTFVGVLKAQRYLVGDIDPDGPEQELEALALKLRDQMEQMARFTPLAKTITYSEVEGPVRAEWVSSERTHDERIILHLHGGGYMMGSPRTHRGMAATLARAAHARVVVPDYRLAPEHPFPAALDDGMLWYRHLLDVGHDPAHIAVTGDSAGGGLAVSLLLAARDEGLPMPACYVGMSPWTDLAGTGESMTTMRDRDPWLRADLVPLAARAYAGEHAADHPGVSPLYADLSGLPPMLVHSGTEEILYDDGRRLVERARAAGVPADLGVFEGMWHVFHAFPGLPESRRALREIGAFIRRHTGDLSGAADAGTTPADDTSAA